MSMTIAAVHEAEQLSLERQEVAAAKWNAVVYAPDLPVAATADEELRRAIEAFRARKLAAIDARLVELGVNPGSKEAAE